VWVTGLSVPHTLMPFPRGGPDRSAKRPKQATTFQLRPTYPYYLANKAYQPNADLEIINKYTGEARPRDPVRAQPRTGWQLTARVSRWQRGSRAPMKVWCARRSGPLSRRSRPWPRCRPTSARPSSCTYAVVCKTRRPRVPWRLTKGRADVTTVGQAV
jgi:hypothetical protein